MRRISAAKMDDHMAAHKILTASLEYDAETSRKLLSSFGGYLGPTAKTMGNASKRVSSAKWGGSGVKRFTCELCGKAFVVMHALRAHLYLHSPGRYFRCKYCNATYKYYEGLRSHIRSRHDGVSLHCPICFRGFPYKSNMKYHLRTHLDIRPFNCSICKRSFKQEGQLKVHNRIHTGEKPFKCYLCQRKFRHKSSFNLHVTTGCMRGPNGSLAMGSCDGDGGGSPGVNEELAILPHHATSSVAIRCHLDPPSGRRRIAAVTAARPVHAKNQPLVVAQYPPPPPPPPPPSSSLSSSISSPSSLAGSLLPAPSPPSPLFVGRGERVLDIDTLLSLHNTSRHPNASARAYSALPEKNIMLLNAMPVNPGLRGVSRGGGGGGGGGGRGRRLKTLSSQSSMETIGRRSED